MKRVPAIVPVTDLRQDVAAALNRLKTSREPLIITQRGRAAAVMLSVDAYEQREYERELLKRLAQGEQKLAKGKGHSLDDERRGMVCHPSNRPW